ncbi:hypothetical protein [Truepera radiovictrix]|uniref:Uncharacterized protein n=1 Tax=Truepera radiovictrix (strain DSM 17093 / CIP 108686 / LMG 22925 / RQ-24) TaxID=649638 RepID=D7CTA5_TRURR|nr:hypothetical protein [Truepera radiovictrix]ADI15568.1 hypothetical protein Trad_2459 [Truepera radiovictrix DSM 17093]WMT58804.1 hypothetical protein RCV51_07625 [Truepera radiovictrix]
MADAPSEESRIKENERVSFVDLGMALYERLTGRGAAINYEFKDMLVEVPRDTGPDAPRATWKLNGTLRITTDETGHPRSAGS